MPNEFLESLPEDIRDNEALKDFSDAGSMAKAFIDTKSMVGGMVRVPDQESSEEDWGKFYGRAGRPEKADGYAFELPNMGNDFKYDDTAITSFKNMAHHVGLNDTQAKGVMNWYMADFTDKVKAGVAEHSANKDAAVTALKTEWGTDYDKKLADAQRAAKQFFGTEGGEFFNDLMARSPDMAKGFADIGSKLSENDSGGDGGAAQKKGGDMTKDEALAEIRKHMEDKEGPYRNKNHPEHRKTVEHVTSLYALMGDSSALEDKS